ncbi:MAG: prepilin peptidase [Clostridium sp.]|uniref:prepilin peptidase n=1 Tax=Clostridium sp. TaxID=1506 RepID=UPI002FC98F64
MVVYTIFVFILGLIIGSFLNVCIYRIPREESISYPPSNCTGCNSNIMWYDLIPVLSYIILRGKCRHCREKISIQYPIVEVLTGVLFTLIYLEFDFTYRFFFFTILTAVLIVTGFIDYYTEYIYEKVSIVGLILAVGYVGYQFYLGEAYGNLILGGLICSGVIAVFAIFKAMGWGDVELALMCGLFLGVYKGVLMLIIAVLLGGIVGSIILIRRKDKSERTMAFGPYIGIGGYIALVYGDYILEFLKNYYGF